MSIYPPLACNPLTVTSDARQGHVPDGTYLLTDVLYSLDYREGFFSEIGLPVYEVLGKRGRVVTIHPTLEVRLLL
jgi:hypothetical protein